MKITIITHAPQGTLGDPALCNHLAQNLLKKYPDLKIKLVITNIDIASHWRAVDGIIDKNENIELKYLPGIIYNLSQEQKQELYDDTDAVLIYPTFHFTSARERVELSALRREKPVFYITNYNFQEQPRYNKLNATFTQQNPDTVLETYEELLEQGFIFETGLVNEAIAGIKLLGINVSEEPLSTAVDLDHIDKIALNESDTKSLRGILQLNSTDELSNAALTHYKQTHDLYLGYYNNLDLEAKMNWQNAPSFVKTCVLYSLRRNSHPKHIDIVLPLSEFSASKNNWDEVIKQLDLHRVTVEFWEKDPNTNELFLSKKVGDGQMTVRLINAYPFARSGMDLLERMSDPFTFVTGNSSLAEAIDYHKVFLYQVMCWHTRLDKDFYEAMTNDALFEPGHPYRRFYEIVHSDTDKKEEQLADLMISHQEAIRAGARRFYAYINEYHNLKKTFPHRLIAKIQIEKEKIESKRQSQTSVGESSTPFLQTSFAEYNEQYRDKYILFQNTGVVDEADKDDLLLLACILQDSKIANQLLQRGANPNTMRTLHNFIYNPLYFCLTHRVDEALFKVIAANDNFDALESIHTIRRNAHVKPFAKLQQGYPQYHMIENLIQAVQKRGQNPSDLFTDNELKKFYDRPGNSSIPGCSLDIIYLDIFIKADIIRASNCQYDFKSFYLDNYEYKLLERKNVSNTLQAFLFEKQGLNFLKKAYYKYQHDITFLRQILYLENQDNTCLLVEFLAQYQSDPMVEEIASKILTIDELSSVMNLAKLKATQTQKASLASGYIDTFNSYDVGINVPSTSSAVAQSSHSSTQVSLAHRRDEDEEENKKETKNRAESDFEIHDLIQRVERMMTNHQNTTELMYGEGGLLTLQAYQYIRKLQIQSILLNGTQLKNVFLDPKDHPLLKNPIFLGENGEPICVDIAHEIDSGSFGSVYLGIRVDSGEICAVKKQLTSTRSQMEKRTLMAFNRHIGSLQQTEDGKLIQYDAQTFKWGSNFKYLIQDEQGKRKPLTFATGLPIACGASQALAAFHQSGRLHRDLNLGNFMWDPNNNVCELVDFGLSVAMNGKLEYIDDANLGMILFRAPEVCQPQEKGTCYNEKTDVYSFGLVLAIFFSNQSFNEVQTSVLDLIKTKYNGDLTALPLAVRECLPEIFNGIDEMNPSQAEVFNLIHAMTHPDANQRPHMQVVEDILNRVKQNQNLRM